MRAQDKHPYDSAILGLNNVYQTIGFDSFYINSDCILATDKTITIEKEYIIFNNPPETGIKMSDVNLVDVYYYQGFINLIVQDIRSQEVYSLDHLIKCPEEACKWVLVDLDYFLDKMNANAIRQYCKCDEAKKETVPEKSHKLEQEDLLEFDF
jgi:hypothetical protein